jgi:hypothetical protein
VTGLNSVVLRTVFVAVRAHIEENHREDREGIAKLLDFFASSFAIFASSRFTRL